MTDAVSATKGGLTAHEIIAVIRANLADIRGCYAALLEKAPDAAGKIPVSILIDGESGRVASSIIADDATLKDASLHRCIEKEIASWQFPKPRDAQDVTLTYPFSFSPL